MTRASKRRILALSLLAVLLLLGFFYAGHRVSTRREAAARLEKARDHFQRQEYLQARYEAVRVLDLEPGNPEASRLCDQALAAFPEPSRLPRVSGVTGEVPFGYPYEASLVRTLRSGILTIPAVGLTVFLAFLLLSRRGRGRLGFFFRALGRTFGRPGRTPGTEARPSRWWRAALVLFILAGLFSLRSFVILALHSLKWYVLALALILVVWGIWRSRLPGFGAALRRAAAWLLFLLPFALILGIHLVYHYSDPGCERIQTDPRVRFLFAACDQDGPGSGEGAAGAFPLERSGRELGAWLRSLGPFPVFEGRIALEPRSLFLSSDRRSVYCVLGYLDYPWPSPVLKVDRATGEVRHIIWMYAPWAGSCPEGSDRCVISSYQGRNVLVVDDRNDRLLEDLKCDPFQPSFLAEDPGRGVVYLPSTLSLAFRETNPTIVNLDYGAPRRFIQTGLASPPTEDNDYNLLVTIEPGTGRVDLTPWAAPKIHGNIAFTVYDRPKDTLMIGNGLPKAAFLFASGPGKELREKNLRLLDFLRTYGFCLGAAFDDEKGLLYISMTTTGELFVYDTRNFEHVDTVPVQPGIRVVQFDSRRRLLYVSHYLGGEIWSLDVDTWSVRDRVFVGPQIRALVHDEARDVLLVASLAGFLEVRLGSGGE